MTTKNKNQAYLFVLLNLIMMGALMIMFLMLSVKS